VFAITAIFAVNAIQKSIKTKLRIAMGKSFVMIAIFAANAT
jgi:hypothetical protein